MAFGSDPRPLSSVREGMTVYDARGDEIGTVDAVRMGEPDAVTDQGQPQGDPQSLVRDFLLPHHALPDEAREKLGRTGYLRIDRSGLMSGAAYAEPGDVARVEGDAVHLNKDQDALIKG